MRRRSAGATSRNPRRAARAALCAGLAGAVCLSVAPPASAERERGDGAFPSQEKVERAERIAAQKASDVGAIKASLLLANQRLEQAAVEAEMAAEAYNGAMWRLQLAGEEVDRARTAAVEARRTVVEQRDAIGALVATTYQQGSEITALSAVMSADGPEGVLDQYAAYQGASDSLQADYDRFAASESLARVFEEEARDAKREQVRLADEASAAKDVAIAAATTAQTAATQIAAEKDQLIRELAAAQNISVELARERQTALEEIARQRAAERARAEAEAAARQQAREDAARARELAHATARQRAQERAQERRDRHEQRQRADRERERDRGDGPAKAPSPPPAPAPPPPPPLAPPSGSGGADRAIAFARAQLGEPYVWAAAGPDSWDCSGLMLGAWGAAGVYLPHYSAAQYYAGSPISSSDLRPGDLVFWGTSSDPDTIHHVAMYIGDGMIIHAPRTGRPVAIDSMYYWIPPNFFARV